ncbi:hypothetical protein BH11CYA1_BH11CYA1_38790 [soil metagenome]
MSDTKTISDSSISQSANFSFAAERDMSSLLVPAYAFRSRDPVPAFIESFSGAGRKIGQLSDIISNCDHRRLVFDGDECFKLSDLMSGGELIGRPVWSQRWKANTAQPLGMYNIALLVEGVRSYRSYSLPRGNKGKWLYRLHTANRQCGVAWTKEDGSEFDPLSAVKPLQLAVRRSARGAIYCCSERYDEDGNACGMTVRLILLKFGFRDARVEIDQSFTRTIVASRVAYSHRPGEVSEPDISDLDASWQTVAARARLIFNTYGQPRDEQAVLWTRQFLEQRRAFREDRSIGGADSFYNQVKAMDWQEALNLVRKPWQLKAVIDTHCNSRFDESVHRSDTNGSRVGRMLSQHVCSEGRLGELRAMVSAFVEPVDQLWSYSGD